MVIRNLVSWAGEDFSHDYGSTVIVADAIGAARVAAGLAVELRPVVSDPVVSYGGTAILYGST